MNAKGEEGSYEPTSLMVSAHNPNPEVISILLETGANINEGDRFGWTSLMTAAAFNPNPEATAILMKAGSDVNARDELGMTPLMYAVEANEYNLEIVITILLRAGADINARDKI